MKLASIGSGSSGNCIYVSNEGHHYLVDAGLSRKRIVDGLKSMDTCPEQIEGIFITHEHMDHISGLGVFLRKYPVPVFATGPTIDAILSAPNLGKIDAGLFHSVKADRPMDLNGIRVEASTIYHDAADPVCYTFTDEESKVGIATDFGTFDDYLVEKMQGCRSLLVESNHDLNMLMVGPYPYPLKRRIMSNTGHMSNERAGQFLSKVIGEECRQIYLGHLSKENNYVDLAYEAVKVELMIHNIDIEKKNITMKVASRTEPTVC
ncbi:MAG: MBL fold metallo-hydrolase [Eubacterium sp.]|nr:MBL fold metallo-hydrolase [Eubacterium sp.]